MSDVIDGMIRINGKEVAIGIAPVVYDPSEDKARPATQADVDQMRNKLECYGLFAQLIRGASPIAVENIRDGLRKLMDCRTF